MPLKYDVDSKHLEAMNAKLREKFPHVLSHPDYQAHVTIAYIKPQFAHLYCGTGALTGMSVECDSAHVRLKDCPPCVVPLRIETPWLLSKLSSCTRQPMISTWWLDCSRDCRERKPIDDCDEEPREA